MAASAAALLDELMGKNRNNAPNEKSTGIQWSDPEVCKHYLVDFCPNELFINTRSDLGPCEKIHDDHLKREYKESSRYKRMNYEEGFMQYLQQIMNDVEKRIKRGHSRLALNSNKLNLVAPHRGPDEEQIAILSERINSLLEQVELLGCEGRVDEAQDIMRHCDKLTHERAQLQAASEVALDTILSQEKQMEVCEVCGAFLIVGDSQTRVDDHLMGKQHMGFAKIKLTIEEIKAKRQKEITDREDKIRKEREEREKEREKEREERRKKEREREKEREERRKDREKRDKERSRRRSRSRSRDRRRRSRSRERRRSRSRDRRRSRSRDRTRDRRRSRSSDRRRSRSRDRHRRSRSKDRKRSRSRERRHERSRSRDHKHSRRSSREKDRSESRSRDSDKNRKERNDGSKSPSKDTSHQMPQENHADEKTQKGMNESREDSSNLDQGSTTNESEKEAPHDEPSDEEQAAF